jgi:hypothetical protein
LIVSVVAGAAAQVTEKKATLTLFAMPWTGSGLTAV